MGRRRLLGAATWPDWIYPLTLLAPLMLAAAMQQLRGQPTLFAGLANGEWGHVLLPAVAAMMITQSCNRILGAVRVFHLSLIGGLELLGLPLPAWSVSGRRSLACSAFGSATSSRRHGKSYPNDRMFRSRFPIHPVAEQIRNKPKG